MNSKKVTLLIVVLSVSIAGVMTARGALLASPPPMTAHVTSVDIEILNVVPSMTFQSNSLGVASTGVAVSRGLFSPQNLTTSFSFAPVNGFIQVNSVLLTIVYFASSPSATGFAVEVNGHAPVSISAPPFPNTALGVLNSQDLRVGANILNIGIILDSSASSGGTFVHQVRMTAEYTYVSSS